MSLRRIWTIFNKDLRDAIRDARVLVALLLPLGIGIFYNFTFDDAAGTSISADVAFFSPGPSALPDMLTAVAGESVDLKFFIAGSAEEVEADLRDDNADLGIILPAGFDEAVRQGRQPNARIVEPSTSTLGGDYVIAALEPALRAFAGQEPPATFTVVAADEPDESETAVDKVGLKRWAVLASIVMMIGMIALLAIPVILAEENEKKTLDALVMIASYREVVLGKAALGMFYIVVMIALLFGLTQYVPERLPLFIATALLTGISLVGFGLLLAGLFKSANQLNTWAGVFLVPVIAPAFVVGLPAPDAIRYVAEATPTGAAMKLLMNSATDESVFSGGVVSFAVIVLWGAVAYAALLWQLSRRQA
jgi:ABC-2 type transport system permease protein